MDSKELTGDVLGEIDLTAEVYHVPASPRGHTGHRLSIGSGESVPDIAEMCRQRKDSW